MARPERFLVAVVAGCLALATAAPAAPLDTDAPLVRGVGQLEDLSQKTIALADRCGRATVWLSFRGARGTGGSGVVVSKDGLVLTAAHVLAAIGSSPMATFPDGTRKNLEILGADYRRDAAMCRIVDEGEYPFVEVGQAENLQRNQWCIAMGHPRGFDGERKAPLRLGRLQSLSRFLITDSAVMSGDSGGPLFDLDGRVIGIHSNIGSSLNQNRHVPISVYRENWDDLKAGKNFGSRPEGQNPRVNPDRVVIGAQLGPPGEYGGVTVRMVIDGGPLAAAGVAEGDELVVFGQTVVKTVEETTSHLQTLKPGDRVELTYVRGGEVRSTTVTLARFGDLMRRLEPQPETERQRPEMEEPPQDRSISLLPPAVEEQQTEADSEATKETNEEPSKETNNDAAGDDALLRKILKDSFRDGGGLRVTPEQVEQLGGTTEMRRKIQQYLRRLGADGIRELRAEAGVESEDKFFLSVIEALRPVVAAAGACAVEVRRDGEPVAHGGVASADGWVLTQDSATRGGEVTLVRSSASAPGELVRRFPKHNLALFKTDLRGLTPVTWRAPDETLPLGEVLTAQAPDGSPLGIGLVSAPERTLEQRGYMGVRLAEDDRGVLFEIVADDSPAALSGVKPGDRLVAVDGEAPGRLANLRRRLRQLEVGDLLSVTVERGGKQVELAIEFGARPATEPNAQRAALNGPVSDRVAGFPQVLQHDLPIVPSQCGGPMLDLQGRCVGVNVARAGREMTFAIPADVVLGLLAEVEPEIERQVSQEEPELSAEALAELKELRRLLEEVRQRLGDAEERLDRIER